MNGNEQSSMSRFIPQPLSIRTLVNGPTASTSTCLTVDKHQGRFNNCSPA